LDADELGCVRCNFKRKTYSKYMHKRTQRSAAHFSHQRRQRLHAKKQTTIYGVEKGGEFVVLWSAALRIALEER